MVTAIVGNVKAAEVIPILDKYFGRLPKGAKPAPLRTLEPPQSAELTITLREKVAADLHRGLSQAVGAASR